MASTPIDGGFSNFPVALRPHGEGRGPKPIVSMKLGKVTAHTPTSGPSVLDKMIKAVYYFILSIADRLGISMSPALDLDPRAISTINDSDAQKFLLRSNKNAALMTTIDVRRFAQILENVNLCVLTDELVKGCAGTMNPRSSILAHATNKDAKDNIIAYPFVFPGGMFKYEHIALIVVDKINKRVFYYDSQGLSSNDPNRKSGNVNLRKQLVALTIDLSATLGGEWAIEENTTKHQINPFDCGNYVMNALLQLDRIDPGHLQQNSNAISDALFMNRQLPGHSSTFHHGGTVIRRNVGRVLLQALQQKQPIQEERDRKERAALVSVQRNKREEVEKVESEYSVL